MKRTLSAVLVLLLLNALLAACGTDETVENSEQNDTETQTETVPETAWIDTVPKTVRYDGESFHIGWSSPFNINECAMSLDESTGDMLSEAVYERNRLVEEKTGVKLTSSEICDGWGYSLTTMENLVLADDKTYDVFDICTLHMFKGSLMGLFTDMSTIDSLDLTHEWWDVETNKIAAFGTNNCYFASGKINFLDDYASECLYFNKNICENLNLDVPYSMVREGKWTMDRFMEYVNAYSIDVNGDGEYDENDCFGFVTNGGALTYFVSGCDVPIIQLNADGLAEVNTSEKMFNVVEYICQNLLDPANTASTIIERGLGYDNADAMFYNSQILFYPGNVGNSNGYRDKMDADFGILPMPKWDEAQQSYKNLYWTAWGTAYGIPVTNTDTEKAGWLLDIMGYFSTDTIYTAAIEKNAKTKVVRDADSADMLDIIFSSKCYDLGQFGSSVYNLYCDITTSGDCGDLASQLSSIAEKTANDFADISLYYSLQ